MRHYLNVCTVDKAHTVVFSRYISNTIALSLLAKSMNSGIVHCFVCVHFAGRTAHSLLGLTMIRNFRAYDTFTSDQVKMVEEAKEPLRADNSANDGQNGTN